MEASCFFLFPMEHVMPPFTVMGEHCSLCGRKNNNGTKKEVVLDRFSWDIYMFFVFSHAKQVCLQYMF